MLHTASSLQLGWAQRRFAAELSRWIRNLPTPLPVGCTEGTKSTCSYRNFASKKSESQQDSTKCEGRPHIIIIGAGPAGIAASTYLLKAGFKHITLLEAENRVGGRIHTASFADNVVDLGAQWCHGEKDNAVYEEVKELGVLGATADLFQRLICLHSNGEVVANDVLAPLREIDGNLWPIGVPPADVMQYEGSLGAYVVDKYWRQVWECTQVEHTLACEYLDSAKKFKQLQLAAENLYEASAKNMLQYRICEGEYLLNWTDKGFITFLRSLLEASDESDLGLLEGRVLFNKRVESIKWRGHKNVLIKCIDGEIFEADHVIVTCSLGVLKENYRRMFLPQLPREKCRAIEGLTMGNAGKFFLEFEQPVCLENGFVLLWSKEDLRKLRDSKYCWLEGVYGFNCYQCQPRILEGWIAGAHCRHMEGMPQSEVLAGLLWLLARYPSLKIAKPTRFLRTQWHSNWNFRGTYSYRSMLTEELGTGAWELAAPILDEAGTPVLQFAGEATHDDFFSTVHGAVESGWREGKRLKSYYDKV